MYLVLRLNKINNKTYVCELYILVFVIITCNTIEKLNTRLEILEINTLQ